MTEDFNLTFGYNTTANGNKEWSFRLDGRPVYPEPRGSYGSIGVFLDRDVPREEAFRRVLMQWVKKGDRK